MEFLSCSIPDLPIGAPVAKAYMKKKEEAEVNGCQPEKLTHTESVELILALLENNPATIIIDALDECDTARRHELLMALGEIIREPAKSSRFYKKQKLFSGKVPEELQDQMITTLIEGAQGMFRWVSLQIQNPCNPQRVKLEADINREIGKLPKTLEELYALVYDQISHSALESRSTTEKSLKLFLCGQRPLQTLESIAAVSVDSEGRCIKLSKDDVLNTCCGMVVLDAELGVFQFAHLSVREYLEGREDFATIETNTLAAERCIDTYPS
ncbi:hypothetical protein FGG08_004611 [Glutinoglossum americanum]|uniref:NACHT domain-containing protein n=1 Tax=Glutinoglossum americanum TaxID=1670608 RepID=A0A9P8I5D3_9PEZI|nr:hypothetical protein FGG08_004611 [Glutinoglossum americanum]